MGRQGRGGFVTRLGAVTAVLLLGAAAAAGGGGANPFAGNAAALKDGERMYDANCAECHGGDGRGGGGPDLADDRWLYGGSDAEIFRSIAEGRPGGMPSWGAELKDEDIWKIIAYVRSLRK